MERADVELAWMKEYGDGKEDRRQLPVARCRRRPRYCEYGKRQGFTRLPLRYPGAQVHKTVLCW